MLSWDPCLKGSFYRGQQSRDTRIRRAQGEPYEHVHYDPLTPQCLHREGTYIIVEA